MVWVFRSRWETDRAEGRLWDHPRGVLYLGDRPGVRKGIGVLYLARELSRYVISLDVIAGPWG